MRVEIMRAKALFLLLAVIPLYLSGINPNQKSELISRLQLDALSLPYQYPDFSLSNNNTGRDGRNFRLTEYLLQKDEYIDPYLENDKNSIYYYVDEYSDRIDSVRVYQWDIDSNDWQYHYSYKYIYDASGEYLLQRVFTYYQMSFTKYYFSYDNQQRLKQMDSYFFETAGDSIRFYSSYYQYGADRIVQEDNYCLWWQMVMSNMYERYEYSHDDNGRITGYDVYGSADSLEYNLHRSIDINYHPDDKSTGEDYIQYLNHGFGNNVFWQKDHFGKLTDITTYFETADTWTYDTRRVFNYDTNGSYDNVTNQYFNNNWHNNYKNQYTYNGNGYPYQVLKRYWNNSNSEWSIPNQIITYTWEQYTANEDDVIPAAPLSLSAYPNPFKQSMNIALQSKSNAPVKAEVYNIKGQLIRTLSSSKTLTWDGTDSDKNPVSNGIYFIRAEQDGKSITQKVIRIK
ncbi:T9SS type A sorting domain-containing protein [Candidatus Poribacteria bacterium]|nr:T9SS type A sorting domain-containing protein [Candidatus Poribacteria bacterium]